VAQGLGAPPPQSTLPRILLFPQTTSNLHIFIVLISSFFTFVEFSKI